MRSGCTIDNWPSGDRRWNTGRMRFNREISVCLSWDLHRKTMIPAWAPRRVPLLSQVYYCPYENCRGVPKQFAKWNQSCALWEENSSLATRHFFYSALIAETLWRRCLAPASARLPLSFVPGRHQGIDAHGAARRNPARRHGYKNQQRRGNQEARGIERADAEKQAVHRSREQGRKRQPGRDARRHHGQAAREDQPANVS